MLLVTHSSTLKMEAFSFSENWALYYPEWFSVAVGPCESEGPKVGRFGYSSPSVPTRRYA
jgi:hypothetical protein